MNDSKDYYDYLGVSRDATIDEIRRTIIRLRRNCQDDVETFSLLQEIQDILCDPKERKKYDSTLLTSGYRHQIDDALAKLRESETEDERIKNLKKAKEVFLNVLHTDEENQEALWHLTHIEQELNNDEKAIEYLKRLGKILEGDDVLEVFHYLGNIYKKLGNVDDAIKCYTLIYKASAEYVEDVKALVRLYYEEKKDVKKTIQILSDCVSRCEDNRLKITYLFEVLRALAYLNTNAYKNVEDTIWRKLGSFAGEDEETNLQCAAALVSAFSELDSDEIIAKYYPQFLRVYQSYHIVNEQLNDAVDAVDQILKLRREGKLHKAIELYNEDVWTDQLRRELASLLAYECAQIKESIETIKKEAPLFWNLEKDNMKDFEDEVNKNLKKSNELRKIKHDTLLNDDLKWMLEMLFLNILVPFDSLKNDFYKARDRFFQLSEEILQKNLIRLESNYPIHYKKLSELFFQNKTTAELFPNRRSASNENKSTQTRTQTHQQSQKQAPVKGNSGNPGLAFLVLLAIIVLIEAPPLGIIIAIGAYVYYQSGKHNGISAAELQQKKEIVKKKRKKLLKVILGIVIGCFILSFALDFFGSKYDDWKQSKLEKHDGYLDQAEFDAIEDTWNEYSKRINTKIVYVENWNEIERYLPGDYEGTYICLCGIFNYEVYNNFLTPEENQRFDEKLAYILESEKLTDVEKVKSYIKLAYEVSKEYEKNLVEVPNVIGLDYEDAIKKLEKKGFVVDEPTYSYSYEYPAEYVLGQWPDAESLLLKDSHISLVVSLGAEPVSVPEISGMWENEAADYLSEYFGLSLGKCLGELYDDFIVAGQICAQVPEIGAMVEEETEIDYYISKGPQNQLDLDTMITVLEGGYPVETVENLLGNPYVIRSRANSITRFIWFETTIGGIQNGQWEYDQPGDDNIPHFIWRIDYLSEQETNNLFLNLGAIPTDYGFSYQNLCIEIVPDYYYPNHKREVYFYIN